MIDTLCGCGHDRGWHWTGRGCAGSADCRCTLYEPVCACGHHSHDHASDPTGGGNTACWVSLVGKTGNWGYPVSQCPCREYNPVVSDTG